MVKTKVLVVYGGQSSEHEVSILSARNVLAALDLSKYEPTLCFIDKTGEWWLQESFSESVNGTEQLLPAPGKGYFVIHPSGGRIEPDVVFPVLHGHNGEDGAIQGLLQLMGIPYAGPSLLSAAVTMNKDLTKQLMKQAGIPVVPSIVWSTVDEVPSYDLVANELGEDVFVKPVSAGSSVGVSHVTSLDAWESALHLAAENSDTVLIEKTIQGREIEIAVLGNSDAQVTMPGEVASNDDFYSYDAKYGDDSASVVTIPASGLSEATINTLRQYALKAYTAVEGRGMARVDFFVTDEESIFLNEINSIPGFTNISMYPKLWQERGVEYKKLVDRLITLAVE